MSRKYKLLFGIVCLVSILAMPTKAVFAEDILDCNFSFTDVRLTVAPDKCKTSDGTLLMRVGGSNLFTDGKGTNYEYSCRSLLGGVTGCDASKVTESRASELTSPSAICSGTSYLSNLATCVSYDFLTLFAWILGIAGMLLNAVIDFTVIKGGTNLNIDAIRSVWITIRDIANIVLIFSLLIIGISTILRVQEYGAKKLLARVILAALLINFSFAATRVVIDASNYISYQFYLGLVKGGTSDKILDSTVGVSGKFMDAVGLGSVYNDSYSGGQASAVKLAQNLSGGRGFLIHMLGCVLFIILAFSFFLAALHFVGRFVVFLLLMATSPLAVIAFFLPFYKNFWNRWWENLWSNAIMAPAYFMLLYFILQILTVFKAKLGGQSFAAFVSEQGPASAINILVNFAIVIALAVISLSAARKIGSEGVHAINLTTKAVGKYGGGILARSTAGRFANNLNESLQKSRFFGGSVPGVALRNLTVGRLANAKFATKKSAVDDAKEAKQRAAVRQYDDNHNDLLASKPVFDKVQRMPAGYVPSPSEQKILDKGWQAWNRMSSEQQQQMGVDFLTGSYGLSLLSSAKVKSFLDEKNDKMSQKDKDKLRETWFKGTSDLNKKVDEAIRSGVPADIESAQNNLRRAINQMNDTDLEMMPAEIMRLDHIRRELVRLPQKLADLEKNNNIAPSIKNEMRNFRRSFIENSIRLAKTDKDSLEQLVKGIPDADAGRIISNINIDSVAPADMPDLINKLDDIITPRRGIMSQVAQHGPTALRNELRSHYETIPAAADTPRDKIKKWLGSNAGITF